MSLKFKGFLNIRALKHKCITGCVHLDAINLILECEKKKNHHITKLQTDITVSLSAKSPTSLTFE